MKSLSSKSLLVLAASTGLAIAAGSTCSASTAFSLDAPSAGGTTGGTGTTSGSTGTIGGCDSQCQLSSLQQTQQMNDIWASGANLLSNSVKNRKRQSTGTTLPALICTDAELCVSEGGVLFCLNALTFDFHDMFGGTGNAETGMYVVPSLLAAQPGATFTAGATINLNDSPTATHTGKTGGAKATSSGSASTGGTHSKSSANNVAPYVGGGVLGAFSFLLGLL